MSNVRYLHRCVNERRFFTAIMRFLGNNANLDYGDGSSYLRSINLWKISLIDIAFTIDYNSRFALWPIGGDCVEVKDWIGTRISG